MFSQPQETADFDLLMIKQGRQRLCESTCESPLLVAGAALMMLHFCVCAARLIQILPTPGRLVIHLSIDNFGPL